MWMVNMWPYNEEDHMEIGTSGWVAIGEGVWRNKFTGHTIDDTGREFDAEGNLIEESDE